MVSILISVYKLFYPPHFLVFRQLLHCDTRVHKKNALTCLKKNNVMTDDNPVILIHKIILCIYLFMYYISYCVIFIFGTQIMQ